MYLSLQLLQSFGISSKEEMIRKLDRNQKVTHVVKVIAGHFSPIVEQLHLVALFSQLFGLFKS